MRAVKRAQNNRNRQGKYLLAQSYELNKFQIPNIFIGSQKRKRRIIPLPPDEIITKQLLN